MTPYEALLQTVRDSQHGVDLGGVDVTVYFDAAYPEHPASPNGGLYHVGIDDVCSADAPALDLALLALPYLEEGDSLLLDSLGQALCAECEGGGCDDCSQTGFDPRPPPRWPRGGINDDGTPGLPLDEVTPQLRQFLLAKHRERITLEGLDEARDRGLLCPSPRGERLNPKGKRLEARLRRSPGKEDAT